MSKQQFKAGDKVRVSAEKNSEWAGVDMTLIEYNEVNDYFSADHPTLGLGGFYGLQHCLQVPVSKAPQKSVPGSYATGKGTTARILQYLQGRKSSEGAGTVYDEVTAATIGSDLGLQPRQISKRLSELVKSKRVGDGWPENGKNTYFFRA